MIGNNRTSKKSLYLALVVGGHGDLIDRFTQNSILKVDYRPIPPEHPELTSCPHKLILKKWKYFVPLEVKLGPFISEPTLLRLRKS